MKKIAFTLITKILLISMKARRMMVNDKNKKKVTKNNK